MAPTITNQAASIYGAYAAPVASSAATLGSTPGTAGGNAAVSTGYNPNPVVGGGATQPTLAQSTQAAAAANGTSVANVQAATTLLANGAAANANLNLPANPGMGSQIANQLTTASGGGAIGDALKSGVSGIVAFAQKGMADIQKAIQGDMAANNGEVDPAKMQLYTMKMSTYELLNQMAAKIQEKEERSIQVWLR